VLELLDWPEDARDRLIEWGSANFDALGAPNARTDAAGPSLMEIAAYADQFAQTQLPAGTMAAGILDAAALAPSLPVGLSAERSEVRDGVHQPDSGQRSRSVRWCS
jgi:hypothetical protein